MMQYTRIVAGPDGRSHVAAAELPLEPFTVDPAAAAVQLMYHTAGGTSAYASSPFDRYLPDINTINQHIVVGPKSYEQAGRLLLGLGTDLDWPLPPHVT